MDANHNGMIDPDEAQGRAQFFLRRLVPDADFSRPIPLDRIRQGFERFRSGQGNSGGNDRGGGSSSSRGDSSKPTVPGFGNEFSTLPVPGFDPSGILIAKVTDEDRRRADFYLQRYDRNHNGSLSRDEARESRRIGDFRADNNGDGRLTKDELATHFARQRAEEEQRNEGQDNGGSGDGGDRGHGRSHGDEDHKDEGSYVVTGGGPKSYRLSTVDDVVPGGLPSWFRERDTNPKDGQIAMAEFTSDWNESEVAKFAAMDRNRDGVLTPQECLAGDSSASPSSHSRGSYSRSDSSSRSRTESVAKSEPKEESTPKAESEAPAKVEGESATRTETAAPSETHVSGVDRRYLDYAQKLIRKYDKNHDTVLTADEWSEISTNPEAADSNRNGKITAEEYAVWLSKQ